ncbi:adenylate/guanylate cyclase domain-containing protein [Mesorhizobium sophorae]|uniref:adenylate/guanylate cyclase domain-containing protein n=1 Tax=Mesorhizobium sophorae TaxID=1300294 RepID=UPI000BA4BB47|nr:adenylate/guanylate cyclase domain-containing protein [Mesorhizobium sophorae]
MAEGRVQRRLAAILAADVVGYTRLMGRDEAGTLGELKTIRADLIDPKMAEHQGRIFKTTGDGVLAEFPSVVNAVACAVDIQRAMSDRNGAIPEARAIQYRIGINVGDVIIEGDDVFGDGVNIAARLEGIAPAGGVTVSGAVRDHLGSRLDLQFDDIGDQTLRNVERPVRAYAVRLDVPGEVPIAQHSDKPSIALLPFVNMSDDRQQDYFADGITENVITGLSRFRDLFVIASNSTFAYKGKATKIQDASRELGARYILEGSVQRSKDRVRITAQLIDGKTGRHLWAERYDRGVDDIFAVQDDVTERIIGSLATAYGGRLLKAWQERPEVAGTRNFEALDYFVRGMESLNRYTKEDNLHARELFEKAGELDPKFGKAFAKLAWTHMIDANDGWSENPEASLANGLKYANLAIERDDAEAWGHYALAGHCLFCGQYERAIIEYQRALELNPNDADVLLDFGSCLSYCGRAQEGLETAQKAIRLNPHYPEWYILQIGQIYYDVRRYHEAIAALEGLRTLDTVYQHLYLAASYAALGSEDEAQQVIEHILQLEPRATITMRTTSDMAPYKNSSDLEHFRENLRKAGLRE